LSRCRLTRPRRDGPRPLIRPGQLARLLRLAPSSAATLVQGLRRAGLVSRTGGQGDRRTASLLLTPDGTATVGRWREANQRILRSAIADEPQAGQNGTAGRR
jgi:DNA-binding MarR family transcriptional regulator